MSKNKEKRLVKEETGLGTPGKARPARKKMLYAIAGSIFALILVLGVFAQNGWLPKTDPYSGECTGWFGTKFPKNSKANHWNPFADPMPSPTPQLSKEYIYAGSRLLAVEDAAASAIPPTDLAIWRPSTGYWWVMAGPGTQQVAQPWGGGADVPAPGDYDGDGKTDFSVYREVASGTSEWWIMRSSDSTYYMVPFGAEGDKPAPADYDGDGMTDVAVFRPSDGTWYILRSSDSGVTIIQFGLGSDIPSPHDFDGDGKADVAVWRDSNKTFYSLNSSDSALSSFLFTVNSTDPVPGDYDGDGRADYAIRDSNNWIIRTSSDGLVTTTAWQQAGDQSVQNDYDADGKVDIAVWRDSNGTWYIRNSADLSTRTVQWGTSGDIPVPAYYRR